jgi:hypothetical protein
VIIASLGVVVALASAAVTANDEVSRWLEQADDGVQSLMDDSIVLRSGPGIDQAALVTLRIGTRVHIDGDRPGWTRVAVLDRDAGPSVGWIPAGHLTPHVVDAATLHERWQEANATGSTALTLAALERAVAFDGADVSALTTLRDLRGMTDVAGAAAIDARLDGRTRVYVADGRGQVVFSFVPARAGSLLATIADEPPLTAGSEDQARLSADARALDGAAWFRVDGATPRAVRGTPFAPAVRRERHRRGLRTVQLGAAPGAWVVTAPVAEEDDGWWHLTLQGFRLRVTPIGGERCVDVGTTGTNARHCLPWTGVRVEVQRGADVEVQALVTNIDGC